MVMGFLFLMMYLVLILLYVLMKREGRLKRSLLFGVFIPENHREDDQVGLFVKRYKKKLRNITVIMAIVPIPLVFINSFTVMFSGFVVWVLAMIVVTSYPFAAVHKEVYEWKMKSQWDVSPLHRQEFAPLVSSPMGVKLKLALVIPFIFTALSMLVPVVCQVSSKILILILGVVFTLSSLILLVLGLLQGKSTPERICKNDEANLTFADQKRNIWVAFYSVTILLTGVLSWSMMLFFAHILLDSYVFMGVIFGYTGILTVFALWAISKINVLRSEISKKEIPVEEGQLKDTDANWIFGMFYYNKDDKNTMVDKRIGEGTTINMAKPAAKVFMVILMISILILPACCVWVGFEEYTPISISYYGNTLRVDHVFTTYEVKKKDITDITMISKLPEATRKMGTGMENLYSGTYKIEGYDDCEVCLNPENKKFLVLKTKKETYIFTGSTDNDTKQIFNELNK